MGDYSWPGNVRELQHTISEEVERRHIREVLEEAGWLIQGGAGHGGAAGVSAFDTAQPDAETGNQEGVMGGSHR